MNEDKMVGWHHWLNGHEYGRRRLPEATFKERAREVALGVGGEERGGETASLAVQQRGSPEG